MLFFLMGLLPILLLGSWAQDWGEQSTGIIQFGSLSILDLLSSKLNVFLSLPLSLSWTIIWVLKDLKMGTISHTHAYFVRVGDGDGDKYIFQGLILFYQWPSLTYETDTCEACWASICVRVMSMPPLNEHFTITPGSRIILF